MESAVTWAALAGVGGLIIAVIKLWTGAYSQIRDVRETAALAALEAGETKQALAGLHNNLTMQTAQFALYRETAAKQAGEYITRDMLREMEQRIGTASQDRFDHLSTQIAAMTSRFDEFMLSMSRPETPRRVR